jgi:hypothetical protein
MKSTIEDKPQTVQLQSIGLVNAKPASEFQVGELTLWNFGYVSEVIAIAPKGKTMLTWTLRSEAGTVGTRNVKASRLVAIAMPRKQAHKIS